MRPNQSNGAQRGGALMIILIVIVVLAVGAFGLFKCAISMIHDEVGKQLRTNPVILEPV